MPVFVGNSTVNTAVANSTITVDQTQNFAYATSNRNSIRPSLNLDFTRSQTVDPRITFTRASSATYFNSLGVLSTAATNVPRIDYNPITGACNGLLIEQASTNLITYSSNVATFGTSFSTLTANAATSPDGTTTAALMIPSTDLNNNHFINNVWNASVGNSITFTVSIFAKSAGYQWIRMNTGNAMGGGYLFFDIINGVIGTYGGVSNPVIQACGNGWFRCSYQYTTPATGTGTIGHQVYAANSNNGFSNWSGNGTSGYYFWGAQVEQLAFPTSYIATTAATATRAVDSATILIGPWYNPSAGTLLAAFYSNLLSSNYTSYNWGIAGFYENNTNNNLIDLFAGSATASVFRVRYNNIVQAYVNPTSPYSLRPNHKVAASWGTNGFFEISDGDTTYLGSAAAATIPTTLSYLDIGTRNIGGVSPSVMWIKSVTYYPVQLSNTEMQSLTSDY